METDEPSVIPSFKAPTDLTDSKKFVHVHHPITSTYKKFKNFRYRWRIDLAKSEKFWKGWFEGLSQKFLDLPVPKLLLLASIDGLDRTLTVGQMQGNDRMILLMTIDYHSVVIVGKFQMQVLARCGHAVHEVTNQIMIEILL